MCIHNDEDIPTREVGLAPLAIEAQGMVVYRVPMGPAVVSFSRQPIALRVLLFCQRLQS